MSVKIDQKADTITITIDTSKAAIEAAPLSTTGKSNLVGSTGGFTMLQNGLKLNVVCTTPLRPDQKA